jgi:hypothetical protein
VLAPRLAEQARVLDVAEVVGQQLALAEQPQHQPVHPHALGLDEVAGERLAPEIDVVEEPHERVQPRRVHLQHRLGVQQRVAQRKHGVDRIARWPAIAPHEAERGCKQRPEAGEVRLRRSALAPAQGSQRPGRVEPLRRGGHPGGGRAQFMAVHEVSLGALEQQPLLRTHLVLQQVAGHREAEPVVLRTLPLLQPAARVVVGPRHQQRGLALAAG